MSAVSFVFNLIDKMSGPASKIAKAVGDTGDAAKKAEKAFEPLPGRLGKVQAALKEAYGDKSAAMFGRFAKGQANASDMAKLAETSIGGIKKGAGIASAGFARMASAATVAAAAVAAVGLAGIGLAGIGAKFALDMFRFKQDTAFAWKYSLGSAEQANTTLGYAQSIANKLGVSTRGVAEQLSKLFGKGLGSREAEMVVQMAADLKAATGQEADVGPIADAIKALKNRAQPLTIEMLSPLTSLGKGASEKVFGSLAKTLGITAKTVEQQKREVLARIGTLKGQKGLDAIAAAYLATTGEKKAGSVAKAFQDTTVTGSIDKIKAKVEALFAKLSGGGLGDSLVKALQKIAAAIDPSTEGGARLVATLEKAGAVASKVFDRIDVDKVVSGFMAIVDAVDSALVPINAFADGLMTGLGDSLGVVMDLVGFMGDGSGASYEFGSALAMVGEALGYVLGGVVLLGGGFAYLVAKAAGIAAFIGGTFTAIGAAIPDGLANGIESAKDRLFDRVKKLAEFLPKIVRDALDTHSPSRVFARIGVDTIAGFSKGVDDEAPKAREVTLSALAPRALTAGSPTAGGARGGAARGGVTIGHISFEVKESANPKQTAEEIRTMIRTVFEDLALESGAVGST
jgi:hypothetical protein